jgi:hypothetical protein
VVSSAIEAFDGSFNGSLAHLKWLRKAQNGSLRGPLKEPPNNLVPINLMASMAEFTTCEKTVFTYERLPQISKVKYLINYWLDFPRILK